MEANSYEYKPKVVYKFPSCIKDINIYDQFPYQYAYLVFILGKNNHKYAVPVSSLLSMTLNILGREERDGKWKMKFIPKEE